MAAVSDRELLTGRRLIFITGASRSGTTLLSFVLRNHGAIFGLRELQYFGQEWDPHSGAREFSRARAVSAAAAIFARQQHGILAARVEAAHRQAAASLVEELGAAASDPAVVFAAAVHELARSAGKSIPCEQTPRNIFYARALLEIYPAAHIVHIVRDPRAVMASQKMRWRLRRNSASANAVSRYEALRVWVNYHPYTVARLWSGATRTALALREHPRVTLLRYEDLVQQPGPTVAGLCARLGLEFEARMLDVGQINSSHQSSVGGARRGLHASAIDKWREVLTPAEIAVTERECAPLMRAFGYEASATRPVGLPAALAMRLTYLAHLGGVLLVNPRRAYVQARAAWRARAPRGGTARAGHTPAVHGELPQ